MEGCQSCAHGFRGELRVSSAHGFRVFGLSGLGSKDQDFCLHLGGLIRFCGVGLQEQRAFVSRLFIEK